MLTITDLSLQRGGVWLLDAVNLTIQPGQRVAIVGANGAGKSSLFQLLLGQLSPEQGSVSLPGGCRIAHMAQEVEASSRSALDFVLDGDHDLRRMERELADAEQRGDDHAMARIHGELDVHEAWSAPRRAAALLRGLGFVDADTARPVSAFSGGWRIRLNLAQALMRPSELLLLDEPTNHLDLEMRQALTMALQNFDGAMVVVSHDRHLLRNTVDEFWLVNDGRVGEYDGDLEDYERWLADRRKDEVDAPRRDPGDALAGNTTGEVAAAEGVGESADDRKARKRAEAAIRQKLSPYRKQQSALEKTMEQLQQQLKVVEESLSAPELYQDSGKAMLKEKLGEQAQLKSRLETVEAEWLEISETVESLEAELVA